MRPFITICLHDIHLVQFHLFYKHGWVSGDALDSLEPFLKSPDISHDASVAEGGAALFAATGTVKRSNCPGLSPKCRTAFASPELFPLRRRAAR